MLQLCPLQTFVMIALEEIPINEIDVSKSFEGHSQVFLPKPVAVHTHTRVSVGQTHCLHLTKIRSVLSFIN